MVFVATKSFLPLCTRSTHTGLVFGGPERYLNSALSALEVNTPAATADSTVDFALALSSSAMVIPILSLKELANFFHLATLPPYKRSALPKLSPEVFRLAIAASSLVRRFR